MRLIPINRETALGPLQTQMNRLFEDFFTPEPGRVAAWMPAADVTETESEVVVRAEIPGIDPATVEVSVFGDTLTLKGEKKEQKEEKGESWLRVERRYGAFTRTLQLPCTVDTEKTRAEAKNGVLTVTMAKREDEKFRRITVKVD